MNAYRSGSAASVRRLFSVARLRRLNLLFAGVLVDFRAPAVARLMNVLVGILLLHLLLLDLVDRVI